MRYAVVESVHIMVQNQTGLTVVWSDGALSAPVQVLSNVEQAHTWLVEQGYQPLPGQSPDLGGLYERYYRVIPVVLL